MPIKIDGATYYRIGEALALANVSRSTYFRWVREKRINDAEHRDRNGRRILTPGEVHTLRSEANQVVRVPDGDDEQIPLHLADPENDV